jgi:chemotaxis protein MotB
MKRPSKTVAKRDDSNAWLETYADMITLLMAFFVVLFAMSTMDAQKYEYMTEVLHKGLNQSFIEKIKEPVEQEAKVEEIRSFISKPVPELDKMSFLTTLADVTLEQRHDGADLVFPDSSLFVPNSARLRDSARPVLEAAVQHLKRVDPKNFVIVVEGHTDGSAPIPRRYKNGWSFSSARAMAMRDALEEGGLDRGILSIAAYADTKPIKGISLEEAATKNRRLVIRIDQL